MARTTRTVEIAALNVAMHRPHSAERYVELFRHAYNAQRVFAQGEIHGLMLGSLQGLAEAIPKNEFTGEIYRFVKIDPNEPWFDMETRAEATPDQVQQINIPPHLLAYMQTIPFVFYPREHELWFVAKDRKATLAINAAERFFQRLLEQTAAMHQMPDVAVTALPDREALDEVLRVPGLHKLELHFKRPNPDGAEDYEARFEQRLAAMNVKSMQETLSAGVDQTLQPDAQLQAEAAVAARNGNVVGVGRGDQGVPIVVTTAQKPKRLHMIVNSAIETVKDVLRRAKAADL